MMMQDDEKKEGEDEECKECPKEEKKEGKDEKKEGKEKEKCECFKQGPPTEKVSILDPKMYQIIANSGGKDKVYKQVHRIE